MGFFVYGLCALTSLLCFALLLRKHCHTPSRLALRSSIAFLCFAIANIILFVDLIVLPHIDLMICRNFANLIGALILLVALTSKHEGMTR